MTCFSPRMSKKAKRRFSTKKIRKTISKNPVTFGVTAALLAVGGIVEAVRRSPSLRERGRGLKENVLRRLSSDHERTSSEGAGLAH